VPCRLPALRCKGTVFIESWDTLKCRVRIDRNLKKFARRRCSSKGAASTAPYDPLVLRSRSEVRAACTSAFEREQSSPPPPVPACLSFEQWYLLYRLEWMLLMLRALNNVLDTEPTPTSPVLQGEGVAFSPTSPAGDDAVDLEGGAEAEAMLIDSIPQPHSPTSTASSASNESAGSIDWCSIGLERAKYWARRMEED